MWIDTHCHLDAAEFDADRDAVAHAARAAGVSRIVIPSVGRDNFTTVRELAQRTPGAVYALGIHPMFTPRARDEDLDRLRMEIEASLDDPRFVAIGEIGLDYFVPGRRRPAAVLLPGATEARARIRPARAVPRAQVAGSRARRAAPIRRAARYRACVQRQLPAGRSVSRAWAASRLWRQRDLHPRAADPPARGAAAARGDRRRDGRTRHRARMGVQIPQHARKVPRIGDVLAELRGIDAGAVSLCTSANALAALPRLALSSA